jgi:hypothetical protein
MAFEGRLRLSASAEDLRDRFPTLDTWLRLNPQWSLLSLKPGADRDDLDLSLRLDEDDRDEAYQARFASADGNRPPWRLELVQNGSIRAIDLELSALDRTCELILRDASVADNDGPARTNMALWLRATADYILLSASPRWRARLSKWLLDRIWLRMNLTGRRVVILIFAYELVGLALLVAWLLWERFAA